MKVWKSARTLLKTVFVCINIIPRISIFLIYSRFTDFVAMQKFLMTFARQLTIVGTFWHFPSAPTPISIPSLQSPRKAQPPLPDSDFNTLAALSTTHLLQTKSLIEKLHQNIDISHKSNEMQFNCNQRHWPPRLRHKSSPTDFHKGPRLGMVRVRWSKVRDWSQSTNNTCLHHEYTVTR